jgi:subtilisin family serine protease
MNLFKKAIEYANRKGVTIVGSAGNAEADIHNPAKLTEYLFGDDANGATHRDPSSNLLIRVSAGNKSKQITFYSNYGVGKIDLMAPGGDLGPNYDPVTRTGRDYTYLCLSTVPILDANGNVTGHGYAWYAGTSMAAPKVAGVAALVIAKHGKNNLSPAQVKAILEQSAEDLYKQGRDEYTGAGLVNAVRALNQR